MDMSGQFFQRSTLGSAQVENSRRKQTLLSLLDALQDMQGVDPKDINAALSREQNETLARLEGRTELPDDGIIAFEQFQNYIQDLDRELQTFANAVSQLGSSVGLVSATFQLRLRLPVLLRCVRDIAASLYPDRVTKENLDLIELIIRDVEVVQQPRAVETILAEQISARGQDVGRILDTLRALKSDLSTFLERLREFPEFHDQVIDRHIIIFRADLEYWLSCLSEYEGHFHTRNVSSYVHGIAMDIGGHLKTLTRALVLLSTVGVPAARFTQEQESAHLLNMSTLATVFSTVTASTIALTSANNSSRLASGVNGFWFLSLIFSVASAVNSLLGLTWTRSIYRSPVHKVPWWVLIWIQRTPLLFLVTSVVAFSIGLVLFAYSSVQSPEVRLVMTVITACSCIGFGAVSTWFTMERWTFSRHQGRIWLKDVLIKAGDDYSLESLASVLRVCAMCTWTTSISYIRTLRDGLMSTVGTVMSRHRSLRQDVEQDLSSGAAHGSSIASRGSAGVLDPATTSHPQFSGDQTVAVPNARFKSIVRMVILMQTANGSNPRYWPPRSTSTALSHSQSQSYLLDRPPVTTGRLARANTLKIALQKLEPVQSSLIHQTVVRSLAFDPDGKSLVTRSWDSTSALINVRNLSVHRVLAQSNGLAGQMLWAPSGSYLLMKLATGINVWNANGVCTQRINRRALVQCIAWFPNGEEFLSVEGNALVHMNLSGIVIGRHVFERVQVHDVAISHNGQRFFAVATLEETNDGMKPIKARAEKRILLYDPIRKVLEIQIPILQDVRHISLTRDNKFAILSFDHKLWKIVADDARLNLHVTYMPKEDTDFAGAGYFGGTEDQFVFCASKAGDIHIWHRETGILLRHILPRDGDSITCMAWNNAAEATMFATGSQEGAVLIWQAPEENLSSERDDN